MADPTSNERDRRVAALAAEIAESETYASELAGFASQMRLAGHEDAAARLLNFSRRHRVSALDLRGRLAALTADQRDP